MQEQRERNLHGGEALWVLKDKIQHPVEKSQSEVDWSEAPEFLFTLRERSCKARGQTRSRLLDYFKKSLFFWMGQVNALGRLPNPNSDFDLYQLMLGPFPHGPGWGVNDLLAAGKGASRTRIGQMTDQLDKLRRQRAAAKGQRTRLGKRLARLANRKEAA